MKYKYVTLSREIDDSGHQGYIVSVTYADDIQLLFFGKKLSDSGLEYIYKDQEITSVIFDGSIKGSYLEIQTIYGTINLTEIISVSTVPSDEINKSEEYPLDQAPIEEEVPEGWIKRDTYDYSYFSQGIIFDAMSDEERKMARKGYKRK